MNTKIRLLTLVFFVASATLPRIGFAGEDVWATLKQGGHVVLMRHSIAQKTNDPLLLKLNDCAVQRNLSDEGRKLAMATGQKFRDNAIPVAEVLASRYCRTQDTAKLTFGRVSGWQPLDLLYAVPDKDKDARTETVTQRIATYAGKGNLIMVSHQPNIDALTLELIEQGGFLVLKPDLDGGFEIVGNFTAEASKSK